MLKALTRHNCYLVYLCGLCSTYTFSHTAILPQIKNKIHLILDNRYSIDNCEMANAFSVQQMSIPKFIHSI